RVEIVLKAPLAEERDEQLLREIDVGVTALAAFDKQAGAVRGTHERVTTDEAVQLRPQARYVRAAQGVAPLRRCAARALRCRRAGRRFGLVLLLFGVRHRGLERLILIGGCYSHVPKFRPSGQICGQARWDGIFSRGEGAVGRRGVSFAVSRVRRKKAVERSPSGLGYGLSNSRSDSLPSARSPRVLPRL